MEISMTPDTFTLKIEKGNAGLWYASSPEIKGLFLAKRTISELLAEVPKCLAALAEAATSRTSMTE
jgi:predicted RNase H-like HicB family nuclease